MPISTIDMLIRVPATTEYHHGSVIGRNLNFPESYYMNSTELI